MKVKGGAISGAKFLSMDPMCRKRETFTNFNDFFFLLLVYKTFKLEQKFKLKNVKINVQVSKLIVLVEQKDLLKIKRDDTKNMGWFMEENYCSTWVFGFHKISNKETLQIIVTLRALLLSILLGYILPIKIFADSGL